MRPSDHPDFFRSVSPRGTRESTIVLDRDGRFFSDGDPVEHRALAGALHNWIDIHPDNGRFILNNGTDWCYFTVEDAPFVVRRIDLTSQGIILELSDGTRELLETGTAALCVGDEDVLYAKVKAGRFEARFSRPAQAGLAEAEYCEEPPAIRFGDISYAIGQRRCLQNGS